MNKLQVVFHLMCFTLETHELFILSNKEETNFEILAKTIDKDILQLMNLIHINKHFDTPKSENLEDIFRHRYDIFFGIPKEILASSLDLKDADLPILNNFFTYGNTSGTTSTSTTRELHKDNHTTINDLQNSTILSSSTLSQISEKSTETNEINNNSMRFLTVTPQTANTVIDEKNRFFPVVLLAFQNTIQNNSMTVTKEINPEHFDNTRLFNDSSRNFQPENKTEAPITILTDLNSFKNQQLLTVFNSTTDSTGFNDHNSFENTTRESDQPVYLS